MIGKLFLELYPQMCIKTPELDKNGVAQLIELISDHGITVVKKSLVDGDMVLIDPANKNNWVHIESKNVAIKNNNGIRFYAIGDNADEIFDETISSVLSLFQLKSIN